MTAVVTGFRGSALRVFFSLSLRMRAGLFAVLLVLVSFPDVIFSGATLVNSAGYFAGVYGTPMAALYPEHEGRSYHHGFNDSGGAVWQSDPMRRYMARVLHDRLSLYWNPYSATGSLGPETLVDQKFSPITLVAAALDGSQLAADATLLLFYALSLYCLYLIVAVNLGLSEGAAIAAGIVYLLGGFNIANLGSNVSHAFVLFPLLLGALMAFVRAPSGARFVLAVAANAMILATTFLPVAFLTFASVYTLAAAYAFSVVDTPGSVSFGRRLLVIVLLVVSFIAALLLMAPLYLPIVESLSLVDSVEMYVKRVFCPVSLRNLIGLISPKHFWESYSAIDAQLFTSDPKGQIRLGNGAFHLGIVPIVVATLALTSNWSRKRVLFAAAFLFVTALGRIYDVNPIAQIMSQVYGVSSLGCQYWWAMVAITFPFLVAFGFDALLGEDRSVFALVAVYALILGSFVLAYRVWGWHEGRYLVQVWYLTFALVIAAATAVLITRARRGTPRAAAWRAGLLILMALELTFYMNHLRPKRNDAVLVPPAMLQFLKQNIGDYRLANFGFAGIPPEFGSAHGIAEVGSMTMSILPWYKLIFEQAFGLPVGRLWGNFASLHFAADPAKIKDPILDLMAVKYLFIPAPWKEHHELLLSRGYRAAYSDAYGTLYLNPSVCRRIYVARTWTQQQGLPDDIPGSPCHRTFTDDPKLIAAARQLGIPESAAQEVEAGDDMQTQGSEGLAVPLCRTLVTDDPKLIAAARLLGIAVTPIGGSSEVQGLKTSSDLIRFGVFLDAPGVVVVADAWHPGWRTTVDKQPVYTGLVNGSFRGIALPSGEHLVEMRYRPRSLSAALAVAALTLTVLVALIPLSGRLRRRLFPSRAKREPPTHRDT